MDPDQISRQHETEKSESYATTVSRIRAKVSFALLRSTLLCLRGSRTSGRVQLQLSDTDLDIDQGNANIRRGIENAISE